MALRGRRVAPASCQPLTPIGHRCRCHPFQWADYAHLGAPDTISAYDPKRTFRAAIQLREIAACQLALARMDVQCLAGLNLQLWLGSLLGLWLTNLLEAERSFDVSTIVLHAR